MNKNNSNETKQNDLCDISCCACKKCSDYDDECVDVIDPIACWMGGDRITRNGISVYTNRADGYCPLAQHCN